MFELFDHTADLGLRVRAPSLVELLRESGRGLLAILVANPEAVRSVQSKTIELAADEPAYLLFDWLSELLYAFDSQKLLLAEFEIELREPALQADRREGEAPAEPGSPRPLVGALIATCRGEPMDASRHTMDHEVKAITYHGLRVERENGEWLAEVIVDI